MQTRRHWLMTPIVALGWAALLGGNGCDSGEPLARLLPSGPSGPSVLLITLDTTRADHLGAYGYGKETSPNLDALAERGVVFEQAISTAANTPVSHASILTGLYPYNHGLRVLHGTTHNTLPLSARTLAERFKSRGYSTAAFVSAFPVSRRFGLDQGFDHFDADFLERPEGEHVGATGNINTGASQRRADVTTDLALAWLAEQTQPVMLWVHYFDPHDVLLLPPKEFVDPREIDAVQRDKLRILYDEEIRYMDQQLGRLLVAFEARSEDTISLVVADHGEGLGDHDWWSHGILYQEQIRVPLILRGPGVPAGERVRQTIRTVDIVPTLLELAELGQDDRHTTPPMDGRSLVPLFRPAAETDLPAEPAASADAAHSEPSEPHGDEDNPSQERHASYSDSFSPMLYQTPTIDPLILFSDERDEILAAVIRDGYKYIHHLRRPEESELYHLESDPAELENLFSEDPHRVEMLRAELEARRWRPELDVPETPMSAEEIEHLRALGYIAEPE